MRRKAPVTAGLNVTVRARAPAAQLVVMRRLTARSRAFAASGLTTWPLTVTRSPLRVTERTNKRRASFKAAERRPPTAALAGAVARAQRACRERGGSREREVRRDDGRGDALAAGGERDRDRLAASGGGRDAADDDARALRIDVDEPQAAVAHSASAERAGSAGTSAGAAPSGGGGMAGGGAVGSAADTVTSAKLCVPTSRAESCVPSLTTSVTRYEPACA